MIENLSFQILDLKEENAITEYKSLVSSIYPNNPFSCLELITTNKNTKEKLFTFILKKDGLPLIIMPFEKNKIEQSLFDIDYYDVSSPYGYSGPFYNSDINDTCLTLFWKKVDEWYKANNVVSEFIRFSLNFNYRCYTGSLHPTLLNVRGYLNSEEFIWNNFKPKVRNNVRKAESENLTFKIFHKNISKETIIQFHDIYISTMERNKAEKRYFFNLNYFTEFILNNPKNCALAMVYKNEKPISTELMLLSDNTVYSHLGGTDSLFFNMRPNDFLKFEVIKWALKKNLKYYILGGGRENNDDLFKYKKTYFPHDNDVIYYTGRKLLLNTISEDLNEFQKNNNPEAYNINIKNGYFPLYRISK